MQEAHERPGKQKLHLRRKGAGAMPPAPAVKELLAARTQRRKHVLQIRRRRSHSTQRRGVERAAAHSEQRDAEDPARDLEAAVRDVLMRHEVTEEVRGYAQQ